MNVHQSVVGKTIESIVGLTENSAEVIIELVGGAKYVQSHEQNCCESVLVSQVDGDLTKHIGQKILTMKEVVSHDCVDCEDNSCTATFYKLSTAKGYLDWRWQGESNGYYSESVDCEFDLSECVYTEKGDEDYPVLPWDTI